MFSCSRLPTIVPDLARRPASAVQLEGERGPLSAARSKAIIDDLQRRGEDTGIFERHLALEEAIVGSLLTTGNKVLLLKDGPATYQAMLAAIQKARDHVNMETDILEDDDVGQRFAQALIDKQKQGVQVNLIHELNAVVLGQEFGDQVRAMFEQDLAQSYAVILEEWDRCPL